MASSKSFVKTLFALIAGASGAAALFTLIMFFRIFAPEWSRMATAWAIISLPLLLEALGTAGLLANWFLGYMRPGRVVDILQWIAGIFGIAAIFDIVMRFTRASAWMMSGPLPFVIDSILILLFALWLLVSHFISKDAKERKVCQFC